MEYITDLSSIVSITEQKSTNKIDKIKRVVLIGELYMNSVKRLKKDGIKIEYANPTKLDFKTANDKVTIYTKNKEYKDITIKKEDSADTIVLMRSGYSNIVVDSLLSYIQKLGILILNNPSSVALSSDKYKTACLLEENGIPQPKFVLVTSSDIDKEDHTMLDEKLKTLYGKLDDDFKYVCKILNGHGGKGVFCCRGKNIVPVLQCLFKLKKNCPILIQDFQEISDGDIRAHVITINGKQKVLSSILRKKGKDFRTNLSLGCDMQEYELDSEQKKLALAAAKASGLEWCGVDMLPLENGKNMVIELNGAPGPSSKIGDPNIEEANYEFFKNLIESIDELI